LLTSDSWLLLINHRLMKPDLAALGLDHQITVGVNFGFWILDFGLTSFDFRVSIFDLQRDSLRVSARGNHKVIFEFALVTVVDNVDPGIDSLTLHFGVSRHAGA